MAAHVSHEIQLYGQRVDQMRGRNAVHERDPFVRNAENLRYSLLAAAVQQALGRPIGEKLTEEEVRQLSLGSDFLADVIAGAKLVTKGEQTAAASASGAVDALGYALGPLEAMERLHLASEDDLLGLFREIQDCLDGSIKSHQVLGSEDALKRTRALFRFLHEGILASLHNRRTPTSGVPADALW